MQWNGLLVGVKECDTMRNLLEDHTAVKAALLYNPHDIKARLLLYWIERAREAEERAEIRSR